jgi:hypothetical protein
MSRRIRAASAPLCPRSGPSDISSLPRLSGLLALELALELEFASAHRRRAILPLLTR